MAPSDPFRTALATIDLLGLAVWAVLDTPPWKVRWSDAVFDNYGLPRGSEPPTNEDYFRLIHPEDANVAAREWRRAAAVEGIHEWRFRLVRPTGEVRHVLTRARRLPPDEQGDRWLCGLDMDVTEQVASDRYLEGERAFRFVAENTRDVILRCARDGTVEFASPSVRHMLGLDADGLVGRRGWDLIHADDLPMVRADLLGRISARQVARPTGIEYRLVRSDGSAVWVESSPRLVFDANGALVGWVDVVRDVTQRREADARIAHMARHDALTGLPNRPEFDRLVGEALAAPTRGDLAVMCLDLDRFKAVNDTLGHAAGDDLLREVARRVSAALPDGRATLARIGGDEFVLFARVADAGGAAALAERIVAKVARPFDLKGHGASVGVSVGVALASPGCADASALIRSADMALYRAKADGRGVHRFFEPGMDEALRARRSLEADLRAAMAAGAFELHYQPLMRMDDGGVSGVEALLRWRRPGHGLLVPADFVPLAEELGLMVAIGGWVLREACRTAADWPEGVRVAVNVSAGQFAHPGFVGSVVSAVASAGIDASRLEVEVTEDVLARDAATTLATLRRLRGLGVRISLDDFGTGYSSLRYLRDFVFDKVKVDRSFVAGIAERRDALPVIRALTGLSASLGMEFAAEGVETEDQLERLRSEGCAEVQGYLVQPPAPAHEIGTWLDARSSRRRVA